MSMAGAMTGKAMAMMAAATALLVLVPCAEAQRERIQVDALDKFVEVSGDGGFRSGGVLVHCRGMTMAVVPAAAAGESLSVRTLAGESLPVEAMWFPAEGEALLLLELGGGADGMPALEIVDVAAGLALGEKVFVYGFGEEGGTVGRVKGRIEAMGLERVELRATAKQAFRAGVAISAKTGALAGFCRSIPLEKKGFRVECLRLDRIGEPSRVSPGQYARGMAAIRRLRESIAATGKEVEAFAAKAEALRGQMAQREGGGLPAITRLEGELKVLSSRLAAMAQRWQGQEVEVEVAFLRRGYRDELARAEAVRERLRGCAETLAATREEHLKWLHSRETRKKL